MSAKRQRAQPPPPPPSRPRARCWNSQCARHFSYSNGEEYEMCPGCRLAVYCTRKCMEAVTGRIAPDHGRWCGGLRYMTNSFPLPIGEEPVAVDQHPRGLALRFPYARRGTCLALAGCYSLDRALADDPGLGGDSRPYSMHPKLLPEGRLRQWQFQRCPGLVLEDRSRAVELLVWGLGHKLVMARDVLAPHIDASRACLLNPGELLDHLFAQPPRVDAFVNEYTEFAKTATATFAPMKFCEHDDETGNCVCVLLLNVDVPDSGLNITVAPRAKYWLFLVAAGLLHGCTRQHSAALSDELCRLYPNDPRGQIARVIIRRWRPPHRR